MYLYFVQSTEGSMLNRRVQQLARKNGVKLKVMERAGLTVKKILQRSNPFEKKSCEREECMVCKYERPGECKMRGCGYQLICKEDGKKYNGQTGRSAYVRIGEEVRDWRKKDERSPLWRHSEVYHGGEDFDLEVKITDKSFGKPRREIMKHGTYYVVEKGVCVLMCVRMYICVCVCVGGEGGMYIFACGVCVFVCVCTIALG